MNWKTVSASPPRRTLDPYIPKKENVEISSLNRPRRLPFHPIWTSKREERKNTYLLLALPLDLTKLLGQLGSGREHRSTLGRLVHDVDDVLPV